MLPALLVIVGIQTIYGIDPHRAISQYPHDQWGLTKGFIGGTIYAITQTADGYLWLGTEKGLVRFDGLTFKLIQHSDTPALPAGPVLGLIGDTEGNLWIRLQTPNIIRYRNGKFENVLSEPRHITAMSQGAHGEVLLATLQNEVLKSDNGKFVTVASKTELPNSITISLAETAGGDIWLGTRDAGLYRLSSRQLTQTVNNLFDQKINCLLLNGDRELLIGTDKGIIRWDGVELTRFNVSPALDHTQIRPCSATAILTSGSAPILTGCCG